MNYSAIVNRSLAIAWKHRYLWVFGFFASMGGGTFSNIGGRASEGDRAAAITGWITSHPGLVLALVFAGAVLLLVLGVLQVLSAGGLVRGTAEASAGRAGGFEQTLSMGYDCFGRVLGLELLLLLIVVGIMLAGFVPPIVMIATKQGVLVALGVAWLLLLLLPALALMIALGLAWNYALRFAALRGDPVGAAVAHGWALARRHLGTTVVLWLVNLAIGFAAGMAMMVAGLLFAIPFVVAGIINLWLGLIPALLIGLPLLVVITAVYGVYEYSYWTIAFTELTAVDDPVPTPPPAAEPTPAKPFELPPTAGMA
ncbi:MAG TPA: hypothetical protein VMF29_05555 [Candidatus Edwardsbacteria bacterium]|nr:hypothetical protein [Candidatus Edwardsbacteria bacterium]